MVVLAAFASMANGMGMDSRDLWDDPYRTDLTRARHRLIATA